MTCCSDNSEGTSCSCDIESHANKMRIVVWCFNSSRIWNVTDCFKFKGYLTCPFSRSVYRHCGLVNLFSLNVATKKVDITFFESTKTFIVQRATSRIKRRHHRIRNKNHKVTRPIVSNVGVLGSIYNGQPFAKVCKGHIRGGDLKFNFFSIRFL